VRRAGLAGDVAEGLSSTVAVIVLLHVLDAMVAWFDCGAKFSPCRLQTREIWRPGSYKIKRVGGGVFLRQSNWKDSGLASCRVGSGTLR